MGRRTVAVLGAGHVGRTLAAAWARAGHDVVLGSREPASARVADLVAGVGAAAGDAAAAGDDAAAGDRGGARVRAAAHREAAAAADVVVVAVPGPQVDALVDGLGDALAGRLVVDTTNDLGAARLDALERLRAAGASPVRAFSCVGWERMREPVVAGERSDMPYAAAAADRPVVEALVGEVGFRPVWFGEDDAAVLAVEHVTRTWLHLVVRQGHDRRLGLRFLVPDPVPGT